MQADSSEHVDCGRAGWRIRASRRLAYLLGAILVVGMGSAVFAAPDARAQGETYEATRVLALLGHVLDRGGDPDGGVRRLREALTRFRAGEARSEHWEARCLEWLGQAAETRGDREESIRHYEAAHALLRRLSPEDALRLDDRLRHR